VVKYRATIMMVLFALICMAAHIWFGWEAAVEEASTHGTTMTWSSYLIEWARDTFENLQSEFWQLAVQFALLVGLFEAISVHAYEKDQEDIKAQLNRLERLLQEQQR
jgi:TRAP-type C4-dicarboxylate transport system permease small subunit